MITYEEMLASQCELAHFNKNHDPRNGQFSSGGSSSLSPRGKQIAKRAGIAAGAMAAISGIQTARNAKAAQQAISEMGFPHKINAVGPGIKQAGKVAVVAALVVIGGHMIKDYMTKSSSKKKSDDK